MASDLELLQRTRPCAGFCLWKKPGKGREPAPSWRRSWMELPVPHGCFMVGQRRVGKPAPSHPAWDCHPDHSTTIICLHFCSVISLFNCITLQQGKKWHQSKDHHVAVHYLPFICWLCFQEDADQQASCPDNLCSRGLISLRRAGRFLPFCNLHYL